MFQTSIYRVNIKEVRVFFSKSMQYLPLMVKIKISTVSSEDFVVNIIEEVHGKVKKPDVLNMARRSLADC